MSSLSDAARTSIKGFCETELAIKQLSDTYKNTCESSLITRNNSYASLTRAMQDDDVDVLELPDGGYIRKIYTKTQCSLKRDDVVSAVENSIAAFRLMPATTCVDSARDTLHKLIRVHVREQRTSDVTRVTHIKTLPRGISEYDIPRASDYITGETRAWLDAQSKLSELRVKHTEAKKDADQTRTSFLEVPGVRDYMKNECPGGKPVRIQGHGDEYTLRFSSSTRRRPVREGHLKEAIEHAVTTLMHAPDTQVVCADMANLIMDTALASAGTESMDLFSLCSRAGRKRAVDGSVK